MADHRACAPPPTQVRTEHRAAHERQGASRSLPSARARERPGPPSVPSPDRPTTFPHPVADAPGDAIASETLRSRAQQAEHVKQADTSASDAVAAAAALSAASSMPGGAASSRGSDASSDARPEPPVIEPLASSLASSEREAQRAHPAAGVCQGGAPQVI